MTPTVPDISGLTLTIPDVEKWDPGKLTTAATAVGKLYTDLDNSVKTATTKIENLQWDGTAAAAAKNRMELEKTRASAVSQALVALESAFNKHEKELSGAKDNVLNLRNMSLMAPTANTPAYSVSPKGEVSADPVIQWMTSHMEDEHGTKVSLIELAKPICEERINALKQTTALQSALLYAQGRAAAACQEIAAAKAKVDAAYDGLGDPNLGVSAAPAPSNAVNPASVTDDSTTPHYQTTNYSTDNGSSDNGTQYNNATYADSGDDSKLEKPSGNVAQWIQQAREILIQEGVPANEIDDNALATIIEHESGGNPEIINHWDSNAAAGHPSKGLMQTIDSTFNSWAVPGHTDIMNPVDNIVSASRYAIHRYGSLSNVPGVVAVRNGHAYVGY